MSVTYYGSGEHPGGFVGFRVVRSWNYGKTYRQGYYSTAAANSQSDTDVYFRYQKLRAEHQDACWAVESLKHQYHRFVTTTKATTKPERGLGVHGITATFAHWHGGGWEPCFSVSRPGKPQKRFFFRHHAFTKAWELSVECWAKGNSILDVDRARVLNSPPDPAQFKRLRRQMNDNEGSSIPVEALSAVFREQRDLINAQRTTEKARLMKLSETSTCNTSLTSTEVDMLEWFESEVEAAG